MSGILDKQPMSEKPESSEEEPFLLTILPFAGVGLLLVLAVVWRVVPGTIEIDAKDETGTPEQLAERVLASFEQATEKEIPIEPGRDFIIGPDDARVTLVEFSDFECPYCRNAANGVRDILAKYPEDVRLVFKQFPLDFTCNPTMDQPMHQFACRAATLSWCAGQQDPELFWDTHDALFREPQLSRDNLRRVAADVSLDIDALTECSESGAALEAIQNDIALGRSLGVSGTPVFFANGRKLSDYRSAALGTVIEHILSN